MTWITSDDFCLILQLLSHQRNISVAYEANTTVKMWEQESVSVSCQLSTTFHTRDQTSTKESRTNSVLGPVDSEFYRLPTVYGSGSLYCTRWISVYSAKQCALPFIDHRYVLSSTHTKAYTNYRPNFKLQFISQLRNGTGTGDSIGLYCSSFQINVANLKRL